MASINYPAGAGVTNEVDPISRIEGHLGIGVKVASGKITDAYAHGNLWRGFENFLIGRAANDAITFVQRICGVCPVPHGMTSTYAVDTVLGYSKGHITFADDGAYGVPAAAVLIRNLVLGMEFLMSSITHFYHLAAPSYIQGPAIPPWTPYFAASYYNPLLLNTGPWAYPIIKASGPGAGFSQDLWSTIIRSYVVALRIRRLTFEAGALFAGRMPMTSVFIGGVVTYDKGEIGTTACQSRCDNFKTIASEVGGFIVQEYVPIALALGALYPNYDNINNANLLYGAASGIWELADAGNVGNAPSTANTGYGAGLGRFLAWGAFPSTAVAASATLALPGGVKFASGDSQTSFTVLNKGQVESTFLASGSNAVPTFLTEDISHSRYAVASADTAAYAASSGVAAYPGAVSRTKPARANGYTYMKAPRWDSLPCEVGPMARSFVSGLFKNASALATTVAAPGIAGYAAYVKPGAAATGLDPQMVKADVAVALVQAGLATLSSASGGGVLVGAASALPSAASATIAAYSNPDTIITGIIYAWILNLKAGYSTMDRLRGRAIESLVLVQQILGAYQNSGTWSANGNFTSTWAGGGWLSQLRGLSTGSDTWKNKAIPAGISQGWGATEAPRGALMHQTTVSSGVIQKYQCIVPTTWNGSPIDAAGNHGAIEAACIGAPFAGTNSPFPSQNGTGTVASVGGVEVLRVAQSFDPCIACAIH